MTKPAAFRATFSDLKLVKTRQVAQLIFEVPLADFDAAYDVLGGLPDSAKEKWFGIAPIVLTANRPEKAKLDWRDVQPAAQAGIRCNEPTFIAFLKENHDVAWRETADSAECVRMICGVNSRVQLGTNHSARVIWHQLDSEYQAWLQLERA